MTPKIPIPITRSMRQSHRASKTHGTAGTVLPFPAGGSPDDAELQAKAAKERAVLASWDDYMELHEIVRVHDVGFQFVARVIRKHYVRVRGAQAA